MKKRLIGLLALLVAGTASAQTPRIPDPRPGLPGPTPELRCTDLGIVGWNGSRSPPGAPLAANEVAIYFQVRNAGPFAYSAPDENKQWLSLVLNTPSGPQTIGVSVLPASGSGAVSLARGASWRGHLRATLPPGVTRTRHPPASLQLNYASPGPDWRPPLDCNSRNNVLSVIFR